jgi:hypothetical protein
VLLGAGTSDRDTFDARHATAKATYDAAEMRLTSMTSDLVLPSSDDVIDRWHTLTLTQQRAVVERLIDRIVIEPRYHGSAGLNRERIGTPKWLA